MKHCFRSSQFNFFNYKFKEALKIKETKVFEKEGLFLILTDDGNTSGIGELSPLKGFSKSPFKTLKENLLNLLPHIIDREFDLKDLNFKKPFFGLFKDLKGSDSNIIFCVEGAIISWLEKTHPQILNKFFKSQKSVPLNGLYIPTKDNIEDVVKVWNHLGLKNIKIKVGRRPISEELALIWDIYRESEGEIKLRIDANLGFSPETFGFFAKNLPNKVIDYIEDPVKDLNLVKDLIVQDKIPVAVDENLLEHLNTPHIKTWVIKPSIVGGYSKAIELIEKAFELGIETVISSCFDSNLSLKYLALLASYQNSFKETACGLDTYRYLENDKSYKMPFVSQGNITF